MLNEILALSNQQFVAFFLAFLRILALIFVAPILGSRSIPIQSKIFFAMFLSICVWPLIKNQPVTPNLELTALTFLSAREVLLGLFFGYNAKLIFEGFQFAGRLIGNQMGLGVAELIDPESGVQVSSIGNFYNLIGVVLFLTLNGHHYLLTALYKSFEIAPVGSGRLVSVLAKERLLSNFDDIFTVAIKLAAPSMAVLFLIEVGMGILARIVPQMNIFFIGLPVRLGLGMFILVASLPMFYILFQTILKAWQGKVTGLMLLF
ncbi:MAG: flagellar biosynthetic protein FliR [bacterium]